jgi:TolA-binding protein
LYVVLLSAVAGPGVSYAQKETPAATRQYAAAARLQNLKSYDLAAEAWVRFIDDFKTDPRVDEAFYNLGVCYYLDDKLDLAVKSFEIVIERFPKLEKLEAAYLYLGAAQSGIAQTGKTEMYDAAVKTLDTLIAKFPQGEYVANALYYKAEALYTQGKRKEAALAYGELIYKYPKHSLAADGTYALGVCQEDLGQPDAAGKTYDQFLKDFSQHPLATEVTLRRGNTLYETGQYAEAIKRFAAAAAAEGFAMADFATVRQADCLAQAKQYVEAAALYLSVPAKFPKSGQIERATLAGGKCYYLGGKYPEVRKALAPSLAGGGAASYEAAHWIARSWLKEKQPAKALEVITKVLPKARADKDPMAVQLLMDQADAIYDTPQRRGESVEFYAAVVGAAPKDPIAPQALYMAAFAALEQGKTDTALKYADTFLFTYPKHDLVADVTHIKAESHLLLGETDEAAPLYEALLKKYSKHPDAELWTVRRALLSFLKKDYEGTIASLGSAEIRRPDLVAQAQYLVGSCQLELKQYKEAVESLKAALAAQPNWSQADENLLALARAYGQSGDHEQAKASAARLIADFPKSTVLDKAHYRLGEYSYLGGDLNEAAAAYRKVIDTWPKSSLVPYALHELGCVEMELKDGAASEATLSKFLTQFPQHALAASARFSRGMARHRLQQYEPAAQDLEAFLAAGPQGPEKSDARYLLGLCQMGIEKHADAVATLQTLLEEDPGYARTDSVLYQLAWALKLSNRPSDADKTFEKLAAGHPDSPHTAEAFYHLGEFAYQNEDYKRAALSYFESQQRAGESDLGEKSSHKLGWAYYHQNDLDKAEKTFRFQLTKYPRGPLAADAAFMEAECFFKQNRFQEALAAFEGIKSLSNADFQTLRLLHAGQAAGQLKQWEKSLELLDQCTDQFPNSPYAAEAYFERGRAHQSLNDDKPALNCYEQVISLTDAEVAARAQFRIGEIQFGRKDHKEAIKSYFKVMDGYSYPTWQAEATFEAARCFEVLEKPDQATKLYEELIEKYPKSDKVPLAKKRIEGLTG